MRDRDRASFTAEAAAAARAIGAAQRDPKLRGPDHVAVRFLGPMLRLAVLPGMRAGFVREFERRAPGVFYHHQARTKYIDEALDSELSAGGLEQIVLLGAGYDSRAHRFADRLRGARVFELDHPATSAAKQERVRRVLGTSPSHLTYVPIDFSRQTLGDRLAEAGYASRRRTFFVWEGVTAYLPRTAIDATLGFVGQAATGSTLVFDYMHRDAFERPDPITQRHLDAAAKLGEPYQFAVNPGELPPLLAPHGLRVEEDVSAHDLGRRFLVSTRGRLWGTIPPCISMAFARRT
jgi:methyltransferase (TIGR00027 family)